MASETPIGLTDGAGQSEVVFEVDAESLGFMLKRGSGALKGQRQITVFCDEPADLMGGDDFAPPPLYYFTIGVLF